MESTKRSWKKIRSLLRRKRRRQKQAQLACQDAADSEDELVDEVDEVDEDESLKQQRLNDLWLQREKEAQAAWLAKQSFYKHQEKIRLQQQEKICREWEELQAKENEEKEKSQAARDQHQQQVKSHLAKIVCDQTLYNCRMAEVSLEANDERLKEIHASHYGSEADSSRSSVTATHNPTPPVDQMLDVPADKICHFYKKVGACRFGQRCSRTHVVPTVSKTLLIANMYSHPSLDSHYEYDTDVTLEYDDQDFYQDFCDFYNDVLPEFDAIGHVIQFKVCCNYEHHLKGNVYVQFSSENEAFNAFKTFNGRWYSGRQLQCSFSPVEKWKPAICGLYHQNRCPKGRNCNFLHVFKNPNGRFKMADKDLLTDAKQRQPKSTQRSEQHSGQSRRTSRRSESHHSTYDWYSDDEDESRNQQISSRRDGSATERARYAEEPRGNKGSNSRKQDKDTDKHSSTKSRSLKKSKTRSRSRNRSRSPEASSTRRRSRSSERSRSQNRSESQHNSKSRKRSRSHERSRSSKRSRSSERSKSRKRSRSHERSKSAKTSGSSERCTNGHTSQSKDGNSVESEEDYTYDVISSSSQRKTDDGSRGKTYWHEQPDNNKSKTKPCNLSMSLSEAQDVKSEEISESIQSVHMAVGADSAGIDRRYCRTPSNYDGSSPES